MSMTLNLVDTLLHQGHRLHKLGRIGDAHRIFLRLAGLRKLPPEAAEASQAMLAEIYLKGGQYRRARRCLRSSGNNILSSELPVLRASACAAVLA